MRVLVLVLQPAGVCLFTCSASGVRCVCKHKVSFARSLVPSPSAPQRRRPGGASTSNGQQSSPSAHYLLPLSRVAFDGILIAGTSLLPHDYTPLSRVSNKSSFSDNRWIRSFGISVAKHCYPPDSRREHWSLRTSYLNHSGYTHGVNHHYILLLVWWNFSVQILTLSDPSLQRGRHGNTSNGL